MWPSGLRRWFQVPVISMTWVRIPPLPLVLDILKGEIEKNFGVFETTDLVLINL